MALGQNIKNKKKSRVNEFAGIKCIWCKQNERTMHQKDLLIISFFCWILLLLLLLYAMLNKMDYFIFSFVSIVNQWHTKPLCT